MKKPMNRHASFMTCPTQDAAMTRKRCTRGAVVPKASAIDCAGASGMMASDRSSFSCASRASLRNVEAEELRVLPADAGHPESGVYAAERSCQLGGNEQVPEPKIGRAPRFRPHERLLPRQRLYACCDQ